MNVLTFSGNLGGDSEMRVTKGGTNVCQFNVAMRSGFGEHETTNWVRCSLFGKRGESLAPYLVKGQAVVVSGEAKLSQWTSKDGEAKASLECRANDVTLMGKKVEGDSKPRPAKQAPKAQVPDFKEFDDDIPFN